MSITKTVASNATASTEVTAQGGILEGANPTVYDPKNPIILFIIQASIIITFCRLLHWPLSKIHQPRVIAEVIGGILLGPSVMGRIPGFTATIFPTTPVNAMPNLTLVAEIGLVLFLFLVGLEVDVRYLVSNLRVAASVALAGMALPFGLGGAVAWGLYDEFKDEPGMVKINFGVFFLFVGVAMAITAFPVLCRILSELKLIMTPVGVIVLSAGVGNDVVGWILLALCVTLVNAGSGISALWVMLACVGYSVVLVYAIRPTFLYILRRAGSLRDGPSQGIIALTLMLVLASSFFTGIIGVHPIFGAFMVGLICPHEGGFAIKVTEKVEDLITTLFLPLYFTLSGLSTNLGLLDNAITWAYVIAVIAIAFATKFAGAAVAARLNGLVWRECFTIGALMSCKGLVELIVLNIGLQAKILSTRTFTIFVVMALVTTFATTPLTAFLYPPWYQKKLEAWKRGEIDWDTGMPTNLDEGSTQGSMTFSKLESSRVQRMLIYLRLDSMPTLFAFLALLGKQSEQEATIARHPSHQSGDTAMEEVGKEGGESKRKTRPLYAHGMRLIELTNRDSSMMKVVEVDEYSMHNPVVNTFRAFGKLNALGVSGEVAITPEDGFADVLVGKASDVAADLLLLPWTETGSMSEALDITPQRVEDKLQAPAYASFVESALASAPCNVAVFVAENFGSVGAAPLKAALRRSWSTNSLRNRRGISDAQETCITDRSHHIFFPFFGGADDRAALRLVMQLATNSDVTVTTVQYQAPDDYYGVTDSSPTATGSSSKAAAIETTDASEAPPTESETDKDNVLFSSLRSSLPEQVASRVVFDSVKTNTPVKDALERAEIEVGLPPRNAGNVVVVGRNAHKNEAFARELALAAKNGEDAVNGSLCAAGPLGRVAHAVVGKGLSASVLVLQARKRQ